ncbi:DUF1499 domain-containing protein [Microbaculum sp. FT89]|uniref:DUF1499 domain-containing protein n=1 Tax=Microbaculum sp. FT89 TaxID=3447298 RepID=UPI003F53D342
MPARYPERWSRQARWSRRLGIFAVPVAVLTTLLHRFADLDTQAGMVLLGVALALALCALILGIGAFTVIWTRGFHGTRQAISGVACAVLVLAWPAWLTAHLVYLPAINDVTTDWFDPPELRQAARVRPPDALSTEYPGKEVAVRQRQAYPEIVPLFLGYSANEVYMAARTLAEDRGWDILYDIPPGLQEAGRIEAVAPTLLFGFRDDVVIVVTRLGPQETRVDMRSVSRFGRHDFGANAARIYDFLTGLTARMEIPVEPEPTS